MTLSNPKFFSPSGGGVVNYLANSNFEAGITGAAAYGEELYVGGVGYLSKWNGTAYTSVGATSAGDAALCAAFDRNGNLWVGGGFTTIGGNSYPYLAVWNGSTWTSVGAPNDRVLTIAVDLNNNVYIGGLFTSVNGVSANKIAYWNGSTWNAMGTGATNNNVFAISTDTNTPPNVYVAGSFTRIGGQSANSGYCAVWNSSTGWAPLGSGFNDVVRSVYVDSSNNLYICGDFTTVSGTTMNRVAKYNGSTWSAFGSGIDSVQANVVGLDSSGNVYVAGSFTSASGVTGSHIAKWNGSTWLTITGANGTVGTINSLVFGSDGSLYVGPVTSIGGVTVNGVGKYNGSVWSAPTNLSTSGTAYCLVLMRRHPTTGTAGISSNLVLSSETAAPLDGTKSLKVTKDAANRQGQGWAFDFTLPLGYLNQINEISLVYKNDANYVSGDIEVLLYNKDTGTRVYPINTTSLTPFTLPAALLGSGKYSFTFLPSDTTNQHYRIIFHVIGTNALAWNFWSDDLSVNPISLGVLPYAKTFNATSDWTDNGTDYYIAIPWSAHLKYYPFPYVTDSSGNVLNLDMNLNSTSTVTIKVPNSVPDQRFAGTVIIR